MPVDSIGYPLPVIIRGYACLNQDEIELAEKDIDPARPRNFPVGRDTSTPVDATSDIRRTTTKVGATDDAVAERRPQILSYAPGGVRTASVATGAVYSVEV